jgi:hypothetical protein
MPISRNTNVPSLFLDPRAQRRTGGGGTELPSAFDPTKFRQQVETSAGEIAAPSLRALEQQTRQAQIAGRFTSPAVQAATQGQILEGFGAGRGQILAGAGQAALGRELPLQQLQQQERQHQIDLMREMEANREASQRQKAASKLQDLQYDLMRQQRLEGTMAGARQRASEFMEKSRQREIESILNRRRGSFAPEKSVSTLSPTASNIIRAFGTKGGR